MSSAIKQKGVTQEKEKPDFKKQESTPNVSLKKLKEKYNKRKQEILAKYPEQKDQLEKIFIKFEVKAKEMPKLYQDSEGLFEYIEYIAKHRRASAQAFEALNEVSEDIDKVKEKVVKFLRQKGADPTFQDKNGWSALLREALKENYPKIAEFLIIKHGADVNAKDKHGLTALMYASRFNHPEIAKLLLDKGADPNLQNNEGWTALMYASRFNNLRIAKLLIEKRADLNIQEQQGWTALMLASQNNHSQIVKLLLENGADLNIQDEYGWTALMYASKNNNPQIVKLLLDKGADPNIKNHDGKTAYNILRDEYQFLPLNDLLAETAEIRGLLDKYKDKQ